MTDPGHEPHVYPSGVQENHGGKVPVVLKLTYVGFVLFGILEIFLPRTNPHTIPKHCQPCQNNQKDLRLLFYYQLVPENPYWDPDYKQLSCYPVVYFPMDTLCHRLRAPLFPIPLPLEVVSLPILYKKQRLSS